MKAGWQRRKIGILASISYGYTEKATSDPVGPRFLRITDIQNDSVDWDSVPFCPIDAESKPRYRLEHGDLVFARTGATTGKSFLVSNPPEAVCASYLIRLRIQSQELLPEFVNLFFQTPEYWQVVSEGTAGSAQGGFNASKLGELSIPFPDLVEQQRLVDILDEAIEGIANAKANTEKNLQNARAIFDSHLQAVFTQRSDGWVEKKLGDLCSFENGDRGTNYPSKSARTESGIPFINAGHLTDDGIDLESMDFISRERFNLLSNGKIRRGDILFCLRGSLGKFADVGELTEGAIASSLVIIRPRESILNEFVMAYLRSENCTEMISHFKNGAAQPNLSAGSLRQFLVPVPSLSLQKSVVLELGALRGETQRLESIYQQKIAALDDLKKSLLHRAFAGEL